MKISVFGCGYVGLTTAVGLAEMGHQVIGVDTDEKKLRQLKGGRVPFFEPGLQELLTRNIREKRLQFTASARTAIQRSDVLFCCVAVPQYKKLDTDLSAVLNVAKAFSTHAGPGKIFINKSTVPVGTSKQIESVILRHQKKENPFWVVSNPEFLREGTAVKDFFQPDRIVIGLPAVTKQSSGSLRKNICRLFHPLAKQGVPILFTTLTNAEIIKYASNAFLANKISFVNELARFCDGVGGDINAVTEGMRHDPRIGPHFLEAGIGFGGSCLPKDLRVLLGIAKRKRIPMNLMKAIADVNDSQPDLIIRKLKNVYPLLAGKRIAVWGLSFKPNTDDLRDAPSHLIIRKLLRLRAKVIVYDPQAMSAFHAEYGSRVGYGDDAYSVLSQADALIVLTEWNEFLNPDFARMKKLMKSAVIVDGRNVFDPEELRAHQFMYSGIGRGA